MSMQLEGKVALVTGSSRGIGAAIAGALAAAGSDVAVHGFQDRERGEQVADRIRAVHRRAIFLEADLTRVESAAWLVQQTIDQLGALDILVNNAGVAILADVFESTPEQWNLAFDLHARALLLLSQAAAEHMKPRGSGKIINITSISGEGVTSPQQVVYCASKAAANMLTRALAVALAPYNIQVNAVLPGTVETEINREQLAGPGVRDGIIRSTPAGRLGRPEDIAAIVVHLAGGGADWTTGVLVPVDGGYML